MNTKNSILAFALLITGLSFNHTLAQSTDAKVTVTKVLDHSSDEIWSLFREMDDIDKYSSGIARVEWTGDKGVGGKRVCYPPQGDGFFTENIINFDDNNRTYGYTVQGTPTKGMVNEIKVVDLGYNKSMVVWTSHYDEFMQNPQMTEDQFTAFMNGAMNEMIGNIAMSADKM